MELSFPFMIIEVKMNRTSAYMSMAELGQIDTTSLPGLLEIKYLFPVGLYHPAFGMAFASMAASLSKGTITGLLKNFFGYGDAHSSFPPEISLSDFPASRR
jgi:hypothetical protein